MFTLQIIVDEYTYFLADGRRVFQLGALFSNLIKSLVVALISNLESFQVHYCLCHT